MSQLIGGDQMMFKIFGSSLIAAGIVLFASTAIAGCETDYNGDGQTNEADVEIFKGALGSSEGDDAYLAGADLNGDGSVTVLDYGILLSCN
jgi:hypothetical protein